MLVGINYPWIDYAWDFGDPPSAWIAPADLSAWRTRKRNKIEEDFRAFAALGLRAVRWFILGDGTSYGTGPQAPRLFGGKWRFEPPDANHSFHRQLAEDFEFVLRSCAQYGLRFAPSLIDFHWCFSGAEIEGSPGIIKGGRGEIITDPLKRDAFFNAVLDPLLDISQRYPESIYAWELINEPEWVIRRWSPLFWRRDRNRTIPLKRMREFLAAGMDRIRTRRLPDGSPALRATVGFAHYETLADWDSSGLGITLHQFHYYAQNQAAVPPHSGSAHQPCFIGELATAVEREWPELQDRQLPQNVSRRLEWLAGKGYPAAFLWSARAKDAATSWTPQEFQGTLASPQELWEQLDEPTVERRAEREGDSGLYCGVDQSHQQDAPQALPSPGRREFPQCQPVCQDCAGEKECQQI